MTTTTIRGTEDHHSLISATAVATAFRQNYPTGRVGIRKCVLHVIGGQEFAVYRTKAGNVVVWVGA